MPEVLCRILDRKVDGGYCAFVCELPEMEKKIVFNPVRGIFTGCRFSVEIMEKIPKASWKIERLTVEKAIEKGVH
ncbi:MAG: hypothetical protein QW279_01775 [Candidatus Jordarchaeaceae archaeon]